MFGGGGTKYLPIPDDPYSKDEGLINGQAVFEYAEYSFGFGTYASSGCAVIAVYNARQLLGQGESLGRISDDFLVCHGTLLGGAWGVAPWDINDYFIANNIPYTGYRSYDAFLSDVSEGDVVIFTIIVAENNIFEGFHTMAAQHQNGSFVVYNVSNDRSTSYLATSLLNMYVDGPSGWVYGYNLGG